MDFQVGDEVEVVREYISMLGNSCIINGAKLIVTSISQDGFIRVRNETAGYSSDRFILSRRKEDICRFNIGDVVKISRKTRDEDLEDHERNFRDARMELTIKGFNVTAMFPVNCVSYDEDDEEAWIGINDLRLVEKA